MMAGIDGIGDGIDVGIGNCLGIGDDDSVGVGIDEYCWWYYGIGIPD